MTVWFRPMPAGLVASSPSLGDIAEAVLASGRGVEDGVARRVVMSRATWSQLVELAETLRGAHNIDVSATEIVTFVLEAVVAKAVRRDDDPTPVPSVPRANRSLGVGFDEPEPKDHM